MEPTRVYRVADARELLSSKGIDVDAIAPLVDGKFMSAFVRAKKPSAMLRARSAADRSSSPRPAWQLAEFRK